MARPIRLAAPVTRAVLVNAAEINDVHERHENQERGKDGDGEHEQTPRMNDFLITGLRAGDKGEAVADHV